MFMRTMPGQVVACPHCGTKNRIPIGGRGKPRCAQCHRDDNPQIATRYQATSIPMLLLMRDGEVVETIMGAQPYPALKAAVDRHL